MKIKIRELENIIKKKLLTKFDQKEIDLITDVIMFGELSGHPTHGILRLIKNNYGIFDSEIKGKPEYARRTAVSTIINARGNPGMLIGQLAAFEVIKLAKKNGFGIVGTYNSFSTTGSLTYYCEKIAQENLIAVIFTQCSPIAAAFNSRKALFGTNPLAFGFPSIPSPLIFDMSTAAITFGAIAKYKLENKKIPENVAIDKNGNMTTDPVQAMEGALLIFESGYKGSGLAMIVEILGSLWTNGSYAGIDQKNGWGNLYLALSPELLNNLYDFKQKTKNLIEVLKNAETRDGKELRIPGENTLRTYYENLKKEEIEINETILNKIIK